MKCKADDDPARLPLQLPASSISSPPSIPPPNPLRSNDHALTPLCLSPLPLLPPLLHPAALSHHRALAPQQMVRAAALLQPTPSHPQARPRRRAGHRRLPQQDHKAAAWAGRCQGRARVHAQGGARGVGWRQEGEGRGERGRVGVLEDAGGVGGVGV